MDFPERVALEIPKGVCEQLPSSQGPGRASAGALPYGGQGA